MPCNKDNCPDYTPQGDGSGDVCSNPCGVTVNKKISPDWNTELINVPSWNRDRIMYYYDDVCEQPALHTLDGSTDPETDGLDLQYGIGGITSPNAGRVRQLLQTGYWWFGNSVICPPYFGYGRNATVPPVPVRYWDHYPSEQSFEPIRSDTWFSYVYDTANGVTGRPCHVYCYYMYTLSSGSGDGATYDTYYGIEKVPYTCPCVPDESYVFYDLEDGKITGEEETDPYPLIWTVGTKQKRIAFSYTGAQISANVYVRAFGLESQPDVKNTLGPETLLYTTSGPNGVELYSEKGTYEKLLKSGNSKHRYNTELQVRSGDTVIALISATFRPVAGVGDSSRQDSKFKLVGIKLRGSNSNSLGNNITYDLYARKEKDQKFTKLGVVRFTNIARSDSKKGVPVTFHMSEPLQVTASTGTNLEQMGFYQVWNGNTSSTYMSSQGNFWKSREANVVQDYALPNGTILRMNISGYWDSDEETYYTRWKIQSIIRYGSDYVLGDGSTYTGQNTYYLYYPSPTAPDKVGVALMVSGASDGEWSEGTTKIIPGETINGWTVTDVKHSTDLFNMHVAYITDGTSDFTKDTIYTSSGGIDVNVKAGWGIKDRAAIVGTYEFQRKEIIYVTGEANLDVPQEDLDVVKPSLQAIVENGKVTGVQILKPGKNLTDPLIEPIIIAIEPPPGFIDKNKYLQFIKDGEDPDIAYEKAKGVGARAFAEAVFAGGELSSIKILNGGSGYSTTKPPLVSVPYIARKFVTTVVPKSSADKEEGGAVNMFKNSEAYKILAKTPYSYDRYTIDETNPTLYQTPIQDSTGEFTGKNRFDITKAKKETVRKNGYSLSDYNQDQKPVYAEKQTIQLKGSIKTILKRKNIQIYVKPKSGLSKESAQAFLPPSNPDYVATKNKDYQNLLDSIDKQTVSNVSYIKSFSDNQRSLFSIDVTSNDVEPTDSFSTNAIDAAKLISISSSNLDDGKYFGKEFRNFYRSLIPGEGDKSIQSTFNQIESEHVKNINSLWQMDEDYNRTMVYDGAAVKVVNYGFFNLPCADRSTKYLIQSFCPDPRKNTFMRITVGVKVAGKDLETPGEEKGPCTKCLLNDSAVMTAYNNLKNTYGASNVDLADAYCQVYYTPSFYSGQEDGAYYGIPYGAYTLPYSSSFFGGYSRAYVKTQFAQQYVYEGCRNYEFSGDLEILHDRMLETLTFAQAINRYGNPYESMCNRYYEDAISIDEPNLNNIVSASDQYDPSAVAQLSDPTLYTE
jgi:hypothetical protein